MTHILLLHASVGMGHQRAAAAVAQALEQAPGVTAQIEDTLDYAHPLFRRSYSGSYLRVADRLPGLWSSFYQRTDVPDQSGGTIATVRELSTTLGLRALPALIERARPAAIVCTHFLPLEALASMRGMALPPIASVVTDYHAHAFWAVPGADRYFVPTAAARAELIAAGIPAARIHASGIPIAPGLNQPIDRLVARRALGLPAWQPIITLIGSGMAVARVRALAGALLARRLPATLVVATGRNHALAGQLADLELCAGPALRVLGPQPSLDPLIAASELVIGKAGGLTVSEVLARGVPMLIPLPVPGQEEWNVAHVVRNGAGGAYTDAGELAGAAEALLHDHALRTTMAAAAAALGRPLAATAIAAHVLADAVRAPLRLWGRPRAATFAPQASVY